jgi:uncharacterized protein YukE
MPDPSPDPSTATRGTAREVSRPIFVAGADPARRVGPAGGSGGSGGARGEIEVEGAVLERTARRLDKASATVASAISEAPAEVDAGEQSELVVRLLERLLTASTEVSQGLETGGRSVLAAARAIQDADDGVLRVRPLSREETR